MMKPTPNEAAQLLASADALRGQINHDAAHESRAFLGWGVFALVMLPPFDVLENNVWGPILGVVALAGWFATMRYYRQRTGRVRLAGFKRWPLLWIPWGIWYGGLIAMAEQFQSQLDVAWTLAGIGAALPLFVIGAVLARQGR